MTQDEQDRVITWHKVDEPGQNPIWESGCGVVEQLAWGDSLLYVGYIAERKEKADITTTTLLSAKHAVELAYVRDHGRVRFAWERDLEDVFVAIKRRRKSARELAKEIPPNEPPAEN